MTKGVRRSTSRTPARRPATKSSVKGRALKAKPARPKSKAASKPPVRKAQKAAPRATAKKLSPKKAVTPAKKKVTKAAKPTKKAATRQPLTRKAAVATAKKSVVPRVKTTQKLAAVRAQRPIVVAPPPRRPPTIDESAALLAFEHAHKEFTNGHFGEARNQFRSLLEKYSQVSEVAARARTYLAVAEARLRTENMLPRDADSLYDRGVIELNRGEYVAAQEMFERALKREPEAAHIHYGLAATRARLGSVDLALQSLQRALDLQPNLRVRAQHDQDLTALRNDPDFDRLIFQPRA
ncbi:MAG TPA: tetratricopeptide repeat protein [Pyrinomonadaceae bacterium]|nr:tetratricopeptide repeat protein [Pyrinomonadaceae bacterium]